MARKPRSDEESIYQVVDRCQRKRWQIFGVLAMISVAIAGGMLTLLLTIRGDVSYTKGRVDTLVEMERKPENAVDYPHGPDFGEELAAESED